MSAMTPELAARVAAVKDRADLEAVVRRRIPALKRAGREWQGCCPFHDERTPSFTVVPDKGFYHCFGCGAHGDAIRFVRDHDGLGFLAALATLEAECGIAQGSGATAPQGARARRESQRPQREDTFVDSLTAAQAVWNSAGHARGALPEVYLRSRGIDTGATGILDVVRYHPRCPVRLWRTWETIGDARETCEAMVIPIASVIGVPGQRRWAMQGVEVVFLAADGRDKMRFPPMRNGKVPPSRKIWGDAGRGACPIPPARWHDWVDASWIEADMARLFVVAEGLESTLSLIERAAPVRGGAATLSLGNLQGGALTTGEGALELHNLRADPARPPFVIDGAGSILIGVDADMKGLKGRKVVERPRGPVVKRDLSGLERTMICETLATAHWRAAGAAMVRTARPTMGNDFNDEAREAA